MKHLLIILMLFLSGYPTSMTAQEVISPGGTHATGSGVLLSWTIGETVIGTFSNGGYILTQGFHQTRLSATAIGDLPAPQLTLSVYPNPLVYVLHLRVDEGDFTKLQYTLLTLGGKALTVKNIVKSLNDIDMQSYANGTYLLRISKKSGELIKNYQVVKTN